MSALSKRSSFLELHRARKQSTEKLAELKRAVKLQKEQIADIEAYQQKKLRKITPPSSCAEQLAAEKRAEVARIAAIDPASEDAWVQRLRTADQPYHNCCTDQAYTSDHLPDRKYYCCIFDPTRELRLCGRCYDFERRDAFYTRYVAEAKLGYLQRKARQPYMQGVDLGLD